MSDFEEIEEELSAIEAILIDGLKVERRPKDGRPTSITYQVKLRCSNTPINKEMPCFMPNMIL
jgi:hypothetical protein